MSNIVKLKCHVNGNSITTIGDTLRRALHDTARLKNDLLMVDGRLIIPANHLLKLARLYKDDRFTITILEDGINVQIDGSIKVDFNLKHQADLRDWPKFRPFVLSPQDTRQNALKPAENKPQDAVIPLARQNTRQAPVKRHPGRKNKPLRPKNSLDHIGLMLLRLADKLDSIGQTA